MDSLCSADHDSKFGRDWQSTAWWMLVVGVLGCAPQRSTSDYIPSSDRARQAVEQMLGAWCEGDAVESGLQILPNGPHIQVFDRQRIGGKKLTKFEVLRETPAEPNRPRALAVTLSFKGDPKPIEATYYVVGIDPILIFRDTEYNQASGMSK